MPISAEHLLGFHSFLISNEDRLSRFREAIRSIVKPGSIVLDLGAGCGILGLLACHAGAKRVYAIESERILDVARLVVAANHSEDRFFFIDRPSVQTDLPERVDALVADIFGSFGTNTGLLGSMIDARTRFLKPGGAIIPRSFQLYVAPIEHAEAYSSIEAWSNDVLGVNFGSVRKFAVNTPVHIRIPGAALLADPVRWAGVSLLEQSATDLSGEVRFTCRRRGVLHGIGGWLEAELVPSITVSNSPLTPSVRYRQFFFPIASPTSVEPGDEIQAHIRSAGNGGAWQWRVRVGDRDFEHASFLGFPVSAVEFRKSSSTYVPELSRLGEATLFVLERFRLKTPVLEIEAAVSKQFSDCLRTPDQVTAFVRQSILQWA